MAKIAVNARFLTQETTGVQRFAYEISRRLRQKEADIVFVCPSNIKQQAWAKELEARVIGKRKGHLWEQTELPAYLHSIGSPRLFSPANTGPAFYQNQTAVIHDIAFIRCPKAFRLPFRLWYGLLCRLLAANCRSLATVSAFSRQEIETVFPKARGKTYVVYNGASQFPAARLNQQPASYFLAVGSMDPRKNLPMLLKAYQDAGLYERFELKIVGSFASVFARQELVLPPGAVWAGRAGDSQLASLYAGARALLYPSFYEGFGLPPVEAMSLGCACIVSDIPVFHEVLGHAALFVDPFSRGAWARAIKKIAEDEALHKDLANRGPKQAAGYSWQKSADAVYKILNMQ